MLGRDGRGQGRKTSAVESRIGPKTGFGLIPGKLLTLKYNLLLPQRGR